MNSPNPGNSPDLTQEQLAFEREKWKADLELRERELSIKEREEARQGKELELKREETRQSRWWNPLVLAILGASLAAFGNAFVGWLNAYEQRQTQDSSDKNQQNLENFKAESSRILEVIKTNDPDKAATNLQFLLDAGLISTPETHDYIKKFLATRKSGQGPSLPSPSDTETAQVSPPGSISSSALKALIGHGYVLGVDASHFDKGIDFQALRDRDVKFAYVKATEGSAKSDPLFDSNVQQATAAGLRVGVYHVMTAEAPELQFKNFAEKLRSVEWNLPPAIDIQDHIWTSDPNVTGDVVAANALNLSTMITKAFGVKPVIYSGRAFALEKKVTLGQSTGPLWVADYSRRAWTGTPRLPNGWSNFTFWQLAPGVSDDPTMAHDIDLFKGSESELDQLQHSK